MREKLSTVLRASLIKVASIVTARYPPIRTRFDRASPLRRAKSMRKRRRDPASLSRLMPTAGSRDFGRTSKMFHLKALPWSQRSSRSAAVHMTWDLLLNLLTIAIRHSGSRRSITLSMGRLGWIVRPSILKGTMARSTTWLRKSTDIHRNSKDSLRGNRLLMRRIHRTRVDSFRSIRLLLVSEESKTRGISSLENTRKEILRKHYSPSKAIR